MNELNFEFGNPGQDAIRSAHRPFQVNKKTGIAQLKLRNGLTVNSLLRKDEWEMLDTAVVQASRYPLVGVADLKSRGLTKSIGSLGTLISQWNSVSEVTGASIGMTVTNTGNRDLPDMTLAGVPIPVIWKEFQVEERMLQASRMMGEGIDNTAAFAASRVVAEKLEDMLFNGSNVVMNSTSLYGYRTHPSRNTATATDLGGGDFGTVGNAVLTFTGALSALRADNKYGPFMVYVSEAQYSQLANVFYTDGTGDTQLDRVRRLGGGNVFIDFKSVNSNILADGEIIVVSMTPDTVDWAEAMDVTMVEWMSGNTMTQTFCVMAVAAPRVKAEYSGKSGILHITGA